MLPVFSYIIYQISFRLEIPVELKSTPLQIQAAELYFVIMAF